jgi:hypothetical protein
VAALLASFGFAVILALLLVERRMGGGAPERAP